MLETATSSVTDRYDNKSGITEKITDGLNTRVSIKRPPSPLLRNIVRQAFAKVFLFQFGNLAFLAQFVDSLVDFVSQFLFFLIEQGVGRNAFIADVGQAVVDLWYGASSLTMLFL